MNSVNKEWVECSEICEKYLITYHVVALLLRR